LEYSPLRDFFQRTRPPTFVFSREVSFPRITCSLDRLQVGVFFFFFFFLFLVTRPLHCFFSLPLNFPSDFSSVSKCPTPFFVYTQIGRPRPCPMCPASVLHFSPVPVITAFLGQPALTRLRPSFGIRDLANTPSQPASKFGPSSATIFEGNFKAVLWRVHPFLQRSYDNRFLQASFLPPQWSFQDEYCFNFSSILPIPCSSWPSSGPYSDMFRPRNLISVIDFRELISNVPAFLVVFYPR